METHIVMKGALLLLTLCIMVPMEVICQSGNANVSLSKPRVVNVGALLTLNSVIGQSAMPALVAAVDDVNSDPTILAGTKLNLILHDTNCSGFLGTVEGREKTRLVNTHNLESFEFKQSEGRVFTWYWKSRLGHYVIGVGFFSHKISR